MGSSCINHEAHVCLFHALDHLEAPTHIRLILATHLHHKETTSLFIPLTQNEILKPVNRRAAATGKISLCQLRFCQLPDGPGYCVRQVRSQHDAYNNWACAYDHGGRSSYHDRAPGLDLDTHQLCDVDNKNNDYTSSKQTKSFQTSQWCRLIRCPCF